MLKKTALFLHDGFPNDKYKPGIRINRQSHTDEDCIGKEDAIRELKKRDLQKKLNCTLRSGVPEWDIERYLKHFYSTNHNFH